MKEHFWEEEFNLGKISEASFMTVAEKWFI